MKREPDSKKGFLLYHDYRKHLAMLSDEERGRLLMALLDYSENGVVTELSGASAMAFSFISWQMDRDSERYEEVCEKRREAGRQGGFAKARNAQSQQETDLANATFAKQNLANGSKPAYINKEANTNKEANAKDIIESTTYSSSETRANMRKAIAAWNSLGSLGVQQVQRIAPDSKRANNLRTRISEYGVEKVLEAIENVRQSDFLQGKSKTSNGWVITFDWFVLPNNFPKVLEGNYSNREPQKGQSSNPFLEYLREEGNSEYNRNG